MLERRLNDSLTQDLSGDNRLLGADVNSILVCLGTPAVFVEGYQSLVEEVRTHALPAKRHMDTVEAAGTLLTLESQKT